MQCRLTPATSFCPQVLQPMMPSNVFRLYASIIRGVNNLGGAKSCVNCAVLFALDCIRYLTLPPAAATTGGPAAALGMQCLVCSCLGVLAPGGYQQVDASRSHPLLVTCPLCPHTFCALQAACPLLSLPRRWACRRQRSLPPSLCPWQPTRRSEGRPCAARCCWARLGAPVVCCISFIAHWRLSIFGRAMW